MGDQRGFSDVPAPVAHSGLTVASGDRGARWLHPGIFEEVALQAATAPSAKIVIVNAGRRFTRK